MTCKAAGRGIEYFSLSCKDDALQVREGALVIEQLTVKSMQKSKENVGSLPKGSKYTDAAILGPSILPGISIAASYRWGFCGTGKFKSSSFDLKI